MIRLFLIFNLAFGYLLANSSVDANIKQTSTKLNSFSQSYLNINKKMEETANAILKQKREIDIQQKHLDSLKKELSEKESSHNENTIQLKDLKKVQNDLKSTQEKLEEELVFTIAQSVSLSIILEEEIAASEESLVEFEVLKVMLDNSKKKVDELNRKFYDNSKNIDVLNTHASFLEVEIANIDTKRKDLLNTQKKNILALKKLEIAKNSYKIELKKLLEKQDALKKTLAKLNIIKVDELNKAKEQEERRKAFDSQKIVSDSSLPKVKRHGSSYQDVKTKEYVGDKTIAPFDPYTITKRYGTYTDPIYGIKVFNESISLKPDSENTKVKTVFNGKVIYADKTAVLDNIVIVEHTNGLHTIYANLSQISPNIKKGMKIKKGYTIGRVSNELIFEVTQKSYHINPIRLFQ
ncbi:peptidoglycan hydrolase LytM, peptidase M23/M37 family [Sulfurimonas gotlandica GD1]|uniref:Peptidoglycan hydrolase LytM, peptidase M23/M37 family n=1 Tax=Sulfurimonas gotlandica (strain DSM 19862 / JCM 16533 / GD1) TaxID=929558 RepID=B6BNM2_SULGG|nr:peptidoglycan DD-metalloendopeptidase family protein [Sulfurimonas gotlandica]EDZ61283.1 peptidase M23B [Sulfurimonas gotlandica GD1]EHP28826.1 peptidoglycan hydrolase LytM, peptidase M23/M37 family [Sulfurimonas gotlandica GD1]